jgi:Activator of Hsp90 ATPase, N-terminal
MHRLITIYDVKIELKWNGTASDGTKVSGTLTIPEVSHEITLDGLSEYVVRIMSLYFLFDSSDIWYSTIGAWQQNPLMPSMRSSKWSGINYHRLWNPSLLNSLLR